MKRKNNIQKSSKNNANKKRNITNTRTYKDIISKKEKDTSMLDFFPLSNPKKKHPMVIESVKLKSKRHYDIVKNPSKPRLSIEKSNEIQKYFTEASSTILIDDAFLSNVVSLIHSDILKISSFIKDNDVLIENISLYNIITKFFLHLNKNIIYIPKELTEKSPMKIRYHNVKLFSGFNHVKDIFLQYSPLNIEESKLFYPKFTQGVIDYIQNFKNEKALYIYSPFDYISDLQKIEIICNDLEYNIIRIDETELNKNYKLNKIAEAMKSQRLPCLPEDINHVLFVLEAMVNNYPHKFSILDKKNDNETIPNSASTEASLFFNPNIIIKNEDSKNNHNITNYFSSNTKENSIYRTIQNNIFTFCNKQKTLILFVDEFSSYQDNPKDNAAHKYLMNIISKLSGSKCPIIVLSNDTSLIGGLSHSTYMNNFKMFFNEIDMKEKERNNMIFQISIIIYLQLMFYKLNYVKLDNSEEMMTIIENIVNIRKKGQSIVINDDDDPNPIEDEYQRIVKVAEYMCYENNFDIEVICHKLLSKFKTFKIEDNGKEKKLNDDLDTLDKDIHKRKKMITLESLANEYEEMSFKDYENSQKKRINTKMFNQIKYISFKKKIYYNISNSNIDNNLEDAKIHNIYDYEDNNNKREASSFNDKSVENVIDSNTIKRLNKEFQKFLLLFFKRNLTTRAIKDYKNMCIKVNKYKPKGLDKYLHLYDRARLIHIINDDYFFYSKTNANTLSNYRLRYTLLEKNLLYN